VAPFRPNLAVLSCCSVRSLATENDEKVLNETDLGQVQPGGPLVAARTACWVEPKLAA